VLKDRIMKMGEVLVGPIGMIFMDGKQVCG
jgi:hypothetical protein